MIADCRTDADHGATADGNVASEMSAGTYVYAIGQAAVMVDRSSGIDDYVLAENRVWIDHRACHEDSTCTDASVGHRCTRMLRARELEALSYCHLCQFQTGRAVSDSNQDRSDAILSQLRKLLASAKHRRATKGLPVPVEVNIVEETGDLVNSLTLDDVCHYAGMAPGTPDDQAGRVCRGAA